MDNFRVPAIDWLMVSPYVIVALAGIFALIAELLRPKANNNALVGISVAGLALALVSLSVQLGMPAGRTVNGMVVRDQFATLLMIVMVGATLLCMFFSDAYLKQKRIAFGEFYPLTLWSLTGGMVMVGTDNLLVQFVGLEILSIALYTLAGMSRNETKSEESALKYFLLGALASAFFLYGTAYVFGASGTTSLFGLTQAFRSEVGPIHSMAQFAMALILVGLGFKAALVPFHQWTPDVYQGAPTNVTAFMSVVSKVAAIGALARLLMAAAPGFDSWYPVLWWIAVATMTVGNLAALAQRDVKRVLAYSSISNAGYILVAVLSHVRAPDKVSLGTAVFFLANYAVMTIGTFAVVGLTAKSGNEGTRFADVAGLWKRAPLAAASVVVFVSSLIGVPPTGGFFAKLSIFWDALQSGQTVLAIVLAVNSAVSLFYYLAIARACFVDDEPAVRAEKAPMSPGLTLTCVVCVAGVLGVTVFGRPVMNVTSWAGTDSAPPALTKGEAQLERIRALGASRSARAKLTESGVPDQR